MRIGIGCILLTDLIIRSLSIKAFFTDEGVLPIEILKQYNWSPVYFSFHAISGDLWWQILLFIINACCIILLIIGFRTRLFTFICWAFLTSLQNRNPFILQGGDDLLRILLFWAVFLPWGERFSVQKKSNYSTDYFSVAAIGYLLLPCSVLFFSALLKTSPEWRSEGTALYYALSLDQIRMPLGTFLYQFPGLLKALTFITFYIELLAPLLILCPFVSKKIRLFGIICICCLFIGIAFTLYVGLFYIISIVSLIGLLPSSVMDWFENHCYKNNTEINTANNDEYKSSSVNHFFYLLKNYALIAVIIFCLMMNLGSVKAFPYGLDPTIVSYGKILRLEQNWGMFSPSILKDDGWFVYSGLNDKLQYIDVKHNRSLVSYTKPNIGVTEFESDRWRKFQENYTFNNNNYMRPFYCKYLLRKWNKEHPDNHISDLTIFFMKETSLPDYQTKPIEKTAVCYCQDKEQ
ncbi:MAG: lipase maturation factor family protein [Bacteroidetes bacterium]|nr:lipase maturation factor family protein [Bacteroidota bacterium]